MATVEEIHTLPELRSVRMAWNHLLVGTPGASFLQSYDWLRLYWHHFGGDQLKFRILLIRSRNDLIGIVPLCVETRRSAGGTLRVLTYPGTRWGVRGTPIGPNPAASLIIAMEYLRTTPRDWDLLELAASDSDLGDRSRTAMALQRAGLSIRQASHPPRSAVRINGSWEEYWAQRSEALRDTLVWQIAELSREQPSGESAHIQYIRHRPAGARFDDCDPRWDLWDACVPLASQAHSHAGPQTTHTAQDSSRPKLLGNEQHQAFAENWHAAATRRGMVDLNLLLVNRRPVAYIYNSICHGELTPIEAGGIRGPRGGDPLWVLTAKMICDSFRLGDRVLRLADTAPKIQNAFRTNQENQAVYRHCPWSAWRAHRERLARWIWGLRPPLNDRHRDAG
jgi:hypothetical protein